MTEAESDSSPGWLCKVYCTRKFVKNNYVKIDIHQQGIKYNLSIERVVELTSEFGSIHKFRHALDEGSKDGLLSWVYILYADRFVRAKVKDTSSEFFKSYFV